MTIKDFLEDKTLTAVETVEGLILNLVGEDKDNNPFYQGLDVDTSNIQEGTSLNRTEEFILTDTELSANGITINIEEVSVNIILDKKIK